MISELVAGQVRSPFRFKPGRLEIDNKHVTTSYKSINKLLLEKKIDDDDLQLLKLIYKYKYLNRRNLEILIAYIGEKNDMEDKKLDGLDVGAGAVTLHRRLKDYKKRLSRLTQYGLVVRYYYLYSDAEENRTPYIYTISKGALSYLKKRLSLFLNINESLILDSNEILFSKLCVNQFRIAALTDSRLTIVPGSMTIDKKVYSPNTSSSFNIYCTFEIMKDEMVKPVIIEPVRKIATWENYINMRTKMINDSIKSRRFLKGKEAPIIIFLCENDLHIEETYLSFVKNHTLIEYQYFFTSDVRVLIDGPFNNIVKCELSHDEYVLLEKYAIAP